MNAQSVQSASEKISGRGGKGGDAPRGLHPISNPSPFDLTAIDLRRPRDVDLVRQAVAENWDVPEHIKDAICDQFNAALEFMDDYRQSQKRRTNYLLRLVRLMLFIDRRNLQLKWNRLRFPGSSVIRMRSRKPEKRRPRRLREPRNVSAATLALLERYLSRHRG